MKKRPVPEGAGRFGACLYGGYFETGMYQYLRYLHPDDGCGGKAGIRCYPSMCLPSPDRPWLLGIKGMLLLAGKSERTLPAASVGECPIPAEYFAMLIVVSR